MPAFFKPTRIALLLLLVTAAALLVLRFSRPDRMLANAIQLQHHLASEETRRLPPDQQLQLQAQMQSVVQQLTPTQRRALAADARQLLVDRVRHYRELPRDEQIAYLNQEINRLISLRQEVAMVTGQQTAARGRNSARGSSSNSPDNASSSSLPDSGNERENYLKVQLDKTTPEERAMVADYVKQLIDQWKSLNLLGPNVPDDPQTILGSLL